MHARDMLHTDKRSGDRPDTEQEKRAVNALSLDTASIARQIAERLRKEVRRSCGHVSALPPNGVWRAALCL